MFYTSKVKDKVNKLTFNDMSIKAVLFDLDGVLLDTESINVISKIEEAKKYGYNVLAEDVIGGFGMCFEAADKYFKSIYGDDFPYSKIRHERFNYIFKSMKENGLPIKPGVIELLDYLDSKNIKKGIVTSSPIEYINSYKTINEEFFNRFDFIVCHDDIKNGKPAPDGYLKGLEFANIKNSEAIVIEDSKSGVLAGVNAKIKTIFVKDLLLPDDEIKSKAYRCFDNIVEVKDLLDKMIYFKLYIFNKVRNIKSNDKIDTFLVEYNNKYYDFIKYKKDNFVNIQGLIDNYYLLNKLRINVPKLFDYSLIDNVIIHEHIEGEFISDLLYENKFTNDLYYRLMNVVEVSKKSRVILDFNSANFILCNRIMYYNCYVVNKPFNEETLNEYLLTWVNEENIEIKLEKVKEIKSKYAQVKRRGKLW